jgi:hypothetical protein
MAFSSDANNIEIKVVVDATGAIKLLDQTGKEIGKLEQAAGKGDKGITKLQGSIIALDSALNVASRAFRSLHQIGAAFFSLMDRADKVEDLTSAFNNLHGGAAAARKELEALQKATAGTMTKMDLMAAANKAALVGLDDGSDRIKKLAEAAKVLGEAAGKGTAESFDALVKAVGTGATRAAKELGVLIKAKKEDETQSQFMARAMDEIISKMREVGESSESGASIAETVGVAWQNLGDDFAVAASQSDTAKEALIGLKAAIDAIKPQALVSIGDAVIGVTQEVIKMAYETGTAMMEGLDAVTPGKMKGSLAEGAQVLLKAYENLGKGATKSAEAVKAHTKIVKEGGTAGGAAAKKTDELAKAYKKLQQQIQEMTGAGGLSKMAQEVKDVLIAQEQGVLTSEQAAAALEKMAEAYKGSADGMTDFSAALKDGEAELRTYQDEVKKTQEEMQKLADEGAGRLTDVFSSLGSELGINFSGGFMDAVQQFMSGSFPETMAMLGGPEAGLIMGIGSTIVNSIGLDKIFSSVKNLFGGNDPQQEFRDSVDEWFKQAFDGKRIKLIINGEMQELEGLDLSQYVGGLDGLSPEQAGGFLNVAEGIKGLFGESFEGFGGQLASALAASVDNLNNLQMLFEQIGLTAEQAGQAVEDAFLNGDLSAGQFLQSSRQIEDLYTQGIPGAVGATDQAIKNFAEGALTSGRIAKDALGDMAAELLEKNPAATLEDLRKELIAAGTSAEDTEKIMASFGKNGIDNLEELTNITTEQTASIVDDLEKQGYAFDKPIEKADELIKRLEELEGKHVTTYVDIVETTIHKEETVQAAKGMIMLASGGIVNSPTMVRRGVIAGEAGPEAVLPLARGADGKLGVRVVNPGGGGGTWGGFNKDYDPGSMGSAIAALMKASEDYAAIMNGLAADTITEAQAAKMLNKLRKESAQLIARQEKLEAKLAYAMEHRGEISGKALQKLLEQLDAVNGKIDEMEGGGANASPEDKIAAIVEQFRAGNITAEEAQKQIGAVEAGGGMGLPGIGDITKAMEDLAGAKGGAAIEALRNLVIEAQEAGYGIGELQDYLEGKGFDINNLFTKFAAEGIDTMDELLRSSDSSLLDFLATIQQQAPGMVALLDGLLNEEEEETNAGGGKGGKKGKKGKQKKKAQAMRELADAMKGIPRNINTTVTIHTKVTGKGAILLDRITPGIGK